MRNATKSAVLSPQEVFCKHMCCKFHGVTEMLYNHIPFTKCFGITNFWDKEFSDLEDLSYRWTQS